MIKLDTFSLKGGIRLVREWPLNERWQSLFPVGSLRVGECAPHRVEVSWTGYESLQMDSLADRTDQVTLPILSR